MIFVPSQSSQTQGDKSEEPSPIESEGVDTAKIVLEVHLPRRRVPFITKPKQQQCLRRPADCLKMSLGMTSSIAIAKRWKIEYVIKKPKADSREDENWGTREWMRRDGREIRPTEFK
jgi:hypothetical protein